MKKLLVIFIALILLTGCTPTTSQPPQEVTGNNDITKEETDMKEVGKSLIELLVEGKFSEITTSIAQTDKLNEVANAAFYEQLWATLEMQYGEYQNFAFSKLIEADGYRIYHFAITFSDFIIEFKTSFDSDGLLAGLHYVPLEEVKKTIGELGGEVVTIGSEYPLQGELVVPESQEPFPLVILVHGSGGNNLDEKVNDIRPFFDIAKGLKEKGIASYRYNKRTFSHASFDMSTFTVYDETIDDAVLAYQQFKDDPRFNGQVYILGHSLGGHVMPLIAENTPDASGYIFMAANYSPLTTLIPYQIEYLANFDGTLDESEKLQIEQIKSLMDQLRSLDGSEEGIFLGSGSAYWALFNNYQPGEKAKAIEKPMLFLQGELDYQVPADEMTYWLDSVNQELTTYHFYPTLSHLMTVGNNPPSNADYSGELIVDQQVIEDIASWINGQ